MSLFREIDEFNKTHKEELREYLEKLGIITQTKEKPRFETITDNTGAWLRDNSTGIEYSKKIGLHLIDH